MSDYIIGIDISKQHLDLHRLPDQATRRVSNSPTGLRELISWIGKRTVTRIVFEATGAYHRTLEQTLGKAGLPLCKVNPRQARRFGEALALNAKTDAVDAAMLARLGTTLDPEIRPAPSELLTSLQELQSARRALIKDRTATINRGDTVTIGLLKRQNKQRLDQIDRQLRAVEKQIKDLIAQDEALSRRWHILCSIPGIAEQTAATLLIDMPELGQLDAKQAGCLAGLAPITRQSGSWIGKAYIKGGRRLVRQALFMPALVACRYNPDLKRKYAQMIANGKPKKVAIIAIMRKIIVMANALIKQDRSWMPNLA